MDKKLRILWVSNAPWTKTGYGVQTGLFTSKLIEMGHEVAILCYYGLEGGILNFAGATCYPKAHEPYGMDVMPQHAKNFQATVIISLMDTWVFQPQQLAGFPWIAYYPVDHEPMPPKVRESLTYAFARVAMSKSGVKETHRQGLDCLYLPHAINTEHYKPKDKTEAREKLKLPKDAFIIGTVAMNKGLPSRKNFAGMLDAFALFKKKHTDAIYYLHTEPMGIDNKSFNVIEKCNLLGLKMGRDVLLPDGYQKYVGYNAEWMSDMYSALDVHLLASTGEGFGIPTLEAQACGCPVIVGDWTAMSELCFSGQKLDKKEASKEYTGIASYQFRAGARQIERALEAEFRKPSPRDRAVRMAKEYDIEIVNEKYFKPVMEKIVGALIERKDRLVDGGRYAKGDKSRRGGGEFAL